MRLREKESRERRKWMRFLEASQRWFWMLYHETVRDDVVIRAQSLSFLMIFSLLPLIAGAFFIFTFLAQFGLVQEALQGMMDNFLMTIPSVHRPFIEEYILQFKDAYLASITETSRSVGIFALAILAWVGLQTFSNVDSTLNYIWSAERSRPLPEKIRNFIVVAVVAPVVLTGGFSVPIILQKIVVTKYLLDKFPLLGVLMNYIIPSLLVLGIFLVMYRYIPVRRVWWRSAFYGALFATVALGITNTLMRFYFQFGMNSAYGKAAVVPLIGFWIYALWIVIILGAEVSFLVQNGKDVFAVNERDPALREGHALLSCLVELLRAHRDGTGSVSFERLRDAAEVDSAAGRAVLQYLLQNKLALEVVGGGDRSGGEYVLARELEAVELDALLADYFSPSEITGARPIDKLWRKGLTHWTSFFKNTHVADLTKER